jgi:hypothetical protein
VGRVNEVLAAELVEPLGRQSAELLVGDPQRRGEQVLLVVLEVDDVGAAEGRDRPLCRLPDDLARRPGADNGLARVLGPAAEDPVQLVVGDAIEARLTDLSDPTTWSFSAERHLDAGGRQLLAEVEGLDDAVHVELAEVEEEDPHRAASFIARVNSSPLNDEGV